MNARFVNVLFDDGEVQVTSVRYLMPIGGSAPCPILNVRTDISSLGKLHILCDLNEFVWGIRPNN